MSAKPIIVVGGENLIDHVTRDGAVSALPGGSPFNVAMALGRQCADVHYVTPISTDDWGDQLATTLTASDVTLAGGRVDAPTTMARVTVTDGIPEYMFERDGTAERMITTESLAASLPAKTAALHTGSLALTDGPDADVWESACKTAFQEGRVVSLDPNVRLSHIPDIDGYRARIFRMMKATHLLKLSDEDLEGLFPGMPQTEALARIRKETSAKLVVMTKGPDGSEAWLGDTHVSRAAPPVPDLVDTVGAGDTFMATLLGGLARIDALSASGIAALTEEDVDGLLRRAGMAAAINCTRSGCNPPSEKELDTAVAKAV